MNKIIIDEITSEKLEALGWTPPESNEIEIPSGCPVLVWDDLDNEKKLSFYCRPTRNTTFPYEAAGGNWWKHCEIDYTRKGCVIPWTGGMCPVDDDAEVTVVMQLDGRFKKVSVVAGALVWPLKDGGSRWNIIAYIAWPDYVTIEEKGERG